MSRSTNVRRPAAAAEDEELRQRGATVVGVVIAGVLASVTIPGPYDFGSMMIGALLLAVLLGYGSWPQGPREAVGFAAAAAFALLLCLALPLSRLFGFAEWTPGATRESYAPWYDHGWPELAIWTVFFVAIFLYCRRRLDRPPRWFTLP